MKTRNLLPTLFLTVLLRGTVLAQALTSVELTPSTVPGGEPTSAKVSISTPAPSGGTLVNLSSSDPGVALTPAFTLVQAGATSSTLQVTTQIVATAKAVTISAKLGGVTRTAVLTVQPTPPVSLVMGAYTLLGATYASQMWDPALNAWRNATGDALVSLTADGQSHSLPVHFEGLTIEPIVQGTGKVTGGAATYTPPGTPPQPENLVLAGFTLLLDGLVIHPTAATAQGRLQLPASVMDVSGGECKPGKLDLGSFPITPTCEFYVPRPAGAFGPWTVGPQALEVSGVNFEADFSPTQSPVLNPPVAPGYRGLVLRSGGTLPAAGEVISNTGYLQAKYAFTDAQVLGTGLKGTLALAQPFEFLALQPAGYKIGLPAGHLDVVDSAVAGGAFTKDLSNPLALPGYITLPPKAILRAADSLPVTVKFESVEVQPDLDLYGDVSLGNNKVTWGELADSQAPIRCYEAGPLDLGHFYLSAASRPAFWPFDGNGAFKNISLATPHTQLEALAMQGVTFRLTDPDPDKATFVVRTPDTPDAQPITLSLISRSSWINVGARGVHADLFSQTSTGAPPDPEKLKLEVGPIHVSSYAPGDGSGQPFGLKLDDVQDLGRSYYWLFQFAESAVYKSDLNGTTFLDAPTKATLGFQHMQFTSTAHNTGAEVEVPDATKMDYWAVDLVQKQNATAAGVMSVKTGQIFLTAAGIGEPRHFARPFFLLWGELLASGQLGRMLFDHDSTGQKFDGFTFTPEVLAFSEYDAADPGGADSYLHVAGTAHFDFFGANYLDLHDARSANAGVPNDGRSITLHEGGEDGAASTDFEVARDWDGPFGSLEFWIKYDENDEDGFVSTDEEIDSNRVGIAYLDKDVGASLELSSKRACISIYEAEKRGVSFPFLPSFGSVKQISGCGCIENGELKRLVLSSQLAGDETGPMVHAGEYVGVEKVLTPATSELTMNGVLFLNVAGGGDVQVNGQVHFLVDRESDFFEGDVQGKLDASSYLGFLQTGGLSAEGQLSWHVGSFENDGYQLLQGKVAIGIVAPAGASGTGVEGGFLLGVNAPKEKAWVIIGSDSRFGVNLDLLPPKLTGVFGYGKYSSSLNAYIISGGYEAYAGIGGFIGEVLPFPEIFGHMNMHIWGDFLGGVVSGSAWTDLQFVLDPAIPPFQGSKFQGKVGVEVCAVWVLCGTAEIAMLVDDKGFHFSD